jgi:uncharacterized BrkB/YihY/UPF0761 family membrane protein
VWTRILTLSWETSKDFSRNGCSYVAAGIAYWALFSLFPLALAAISVLGFLYPTPVEQGRVAEEIIQQIPVSGDYLADLVSEVARSRGVLGTLAVAGLLLSGIRVFASVRRGINHAWNTGSSHTFLVARGSTWPCWRPPPSSPCCLSCSPPTPWACRSPSPCRRDRAPG